MYNYRLGINHSHLLPKNSLKFVILRAQEFGSRSFPLAYDVISEYHVN